VGQISIASNGGNTIIPVNILINTTVDNKDKPNLVSSYKLEQNYPNPFNPSTKIRWHLPENSFVTLKVYDINGEEIATLINEFRNAGIHETVFDANDLSKGYTLTSGVYFYRLVSENFVDTKKFVLLK
jgi:hypothetical protein